MGLVTRQIGPNAKGSKLTFAEMDNNLYYLQGLGVSGLTFSANTLTLINPTGGTKTVTINTGSNFTGGTVSGSTLFTDGLSANTISATTISGGTLYGDGSNLTGISGGSSFLRNQTNSGVTDTIKINESIFNPSNLTVLSSSIFIIETNADYYLLGDLYNYGEIIVEGVLKVGGTIYNNGAITGTGIIE